MRFVITHEGHVGGPTVGWHLVLGDEEDCIGAGDAVADPLCKASEFVGGRGGPSAIGGGVADELAVVQLLACVIKHSCADVGVILGRGVGLAMTAEGREELELLHCVVFVVGVEAMMG